MLRNSRSTNPVFFSMAVPFSVVNPTVPPLIVHFSGQPPQNTAGYGSAAMNGRSVSARLKILQILGAEQSSSSPSLRLGSGMGGWACGRKSFGRRSLRLTTVDRSAERSTRSAGRPPAPAGSTTDPRSCGRTGASRRSGGRTIDGRKDGRRSGWIVYEDFRSSRTMRAVTDM